MTVAGARLGNAETGIAVCGILETGCAVMGLALLVMERMARAEEANKQNTEKK